MDVIAEIGANWEGNVTNAKKIILESKRAGADAVKFQMWRADDLYSPNHPSWKEIKKSEMTFEKVRMLKRIADDARIDFFCSAFYPEAVDFLESLDVKHYKVASRTCLFKDPYSKETLERKASTGKPIIISMGMGGNKKKIERIFRNNKTIFCYCISQYPLDFNKINWKDAKKYEGFSDHTMGIIAPILFAVLRKELDAKYAYIEKHVKLEDSKGPDAATSIDTKSLAELVSYIRIIEKAKL